MAVTEIASLDETGRLLLEIEALREQTDYQNRGCPGESFEKALTIPDIWLGDELDEASRRGDVTAIQNIGQAAFVRLVDATEVHESIRRGAAFRQANSLLVRFASQQG